MNMLTMVLVTVAHSSFGSIGFVININNKSYNSTGNNCIVMYTIIEYYTSVLSSKTSPDSLLLEWRPLGPAELKTCTFSQSHIPHHHLSELFINLIYLATIPSILAPGRTGLAPSSSLLSTASPPGIDWCPCCVFVYLKLCKCISRASPHGIDWRPFCVFVYVCICVCVYLCVCVFVYLCVCVFVFVFLKLCKCISSASPPETDWDPVCVFAFGILWRWYSWLFSPTSPPWDCPS